MLFIFCLVVLTTIPENTNCDYPAKRMLLAEDLTTQIQALTIRMTRLEGENCLNLYGHAFCWIFGKFSRYTHTCFSDHLY
jgi:hypothetical protein